MKKIAVIGICGMSVFMPVPHFHENGETLIASGLYQEIGGKGINQAVAAARMGARVSFLAAVGDDDFGKECQSVESEENLNCTFVVKQGAATPVAFILTDKSGENRVTEYQSAVLCEQDVMAFASKIKEADVLLLQQEVPEAVNAAAVEIAKKHHVKVILNPAPARQMHLLTAKEIYLVTPNEQERKAIDTTFFQNCITTLGKQGCSINDQVFVPSIHTNAVNTTGAGDAFNGALAVCIAEGMPVEEACRYAVTAAGISVESKLVLEAMPNREEVERRMKNEKV